MKKIVLATALLASASASALDFTVLAGVDSNNGPAVAAELGFGAGLIGIKTMMGTETKNFLRSSPADNNGDGWRLKEEQSDSAIYGGYRFDNGLSVKAGFAMSQYKSSFEKSGESVLNTAFRPMVGLGYQFGESWGIDLHYTTSATVDAYDISQETLLQDYKTYTFEDSATVMVGYRF